MDYRWAFREDTVMLAGCGGVPNYPVIERRPLPGLYFSFQCVVHWVVSGSMELADTRVAIT
eukprot:796701-Prorocentrum_lima.AAC.1